MDLLSLAVGIALGASFPLVFKKIWTLAKSKFSSVVVSTNTTDTPK